MYEGQRNCMSRGVGTVHYAIAQRTSGDGVQRQFHSVNAFSMGTAIGTR